MTHPPEPDNTEHHRPQEPADGTVPCASCTKPTVANTAPLLPQGFMCNLCITRRPAVTS
ncbi:hypothetical protein [Catellatospora methionotrophica]|uniref:hypothetical protein n=1 Tax=Catellatospora methionotrophica TaxID=121620 RepID=UPI0033DED245